MNQTLSDPGYPLIDYPTLWQHVTQHFEMGTHSIHGPRHWKQVEHNGLRIAQTNQADETVVRLFAVFHDSCRWSEGYDPQHGQRGAELAIQLHGDLFQVEPAQLELLVIACELHHQGALSDDPTVGTCFDADRLDLPRVGIIPDPNKMCTAEGKRLAGDRSSSR